MLPRVRRVRRPRRTRAARPVAALLTATLGLSLVGCGSDEPDTISSDSSPSAETSSAAADKPDEARTETHRDRASGAGVSFDVPKGWVSVSAEVLQQRAEDSADLADAAEQTGMGIDELVETVGQAEVFLTNPDSSRAGHDDTINVMSPGGAVPSAEQIEQDFASVGASVESVTTHDSDLGEVVAAVYELSMSGTTILGEALVVEVDGEAVIITVSTHDRALTDTLADGVVASLDSA